MQRFEWMWDDRNLTRVLVAALSKSSEPNRRTVESAFVQASCLVEVAPTVVEGPVNHHYRQLAGARLALQRFARYTST
jgi:hypothetical protein